MKAGSVDVNSFIQIANQIVGFLPRILQLAYFLLLVALLARIAGRQWIIKALPTTELAAVCIALGLALR